MRSFTATQQLELEPYTRIDEPAIHSERRVGRIGEGAGAAHLHGGVWDASSQILRRKCIEEIFSSDGERILAPAVGHLEICQPCRRIGLIILWKDGKAAEFAIPGLSRGDVPRPLTVALHQTAVVAWLPALEAALLATVKEYGAKTCELRGRRCDVDDLRLVVAVRGGEIDMAVEQRPLMVGHEIESVGARVDRVREEACTAGAKGREERLHLRLIEVARQDDAVLDIDVEEVRGHLQVGHRLPHRTSAIVPRRLWPQRLSAKRHGDRTANRSRPYFEGENVPAGRVSKEVRAHRREP